MAPALKADHFRNGSKTVLTAPNATSVSSDQLTSSAIAFKRSQNSAFVLAPSQGRMVVQAAWRDVTLIISGRVDDVARMNMIENWITKPKGASGSCSNAGAGA
jgi:hypothetical protein